MAKRLRTGFRNEAGKAQEESEVHGQKKDHTLFHELMDLPEGSRRMLPPEELDLHPENFSLVPELDEKKRAALKSDILSAGIREPLHVWPVDGKLYVVSGNERLLILKSFSEKERGLSGTRVVPCIIYRFEKAARARQHIITVNENRKNVNLSPAKRLPALFPPAEYPLIYADLRGYSPGHQIEEAKLPGGNFELKVPGTIESLRQIQKEERALVSDVTGWSAAFVAKVINQYASILKSDSGPGEISSADRSKIEAAKRKKEALLPRWQKAREAHEKALSKLKELEKQIQAQDRVLKKFGALD